MVVMISEKNTIIFQAKTSQDEKLFDKNPLKSKIHIKIYKTSLSQFSTMPQA